MKMVYESGIESIVEPICGKPHRISLKYVEAKDCYEVGIWFANLRADYELKDGDMDAFAEWFAAEYYQHKLFGRLNAN